MPPRIAQALTFSPQLRPPLPQVSASSGAGVKALFTSLFARILATVPTIPEDLTALAVQQANMARGEDA